MEQKNQLNDPRLLKGKVLPILEKIGKCIHLISIDKFCEDISVGLYEKNEMMTVWTFTKGEKAASRIQQIKERLIDLNIDQIGLDLNDYKVALPLAGIIIAELSGEFDHEKAIASFLQSF